MDCRRLLRHKVFTVSTTFQIRVNQKYLSYPHYKYNLGSEWPTLLVHYKAGVPVGKSSVSYQYLSGTVVQKWYWFGFSRTNGFGCETWRLFICRSITFIDYKHLSRGMNSPCYNTNNFSDTFPESTLLCIEYRQWIFFSRLQHHFNGYILNKLPLVRKLGWSLVPGVKYLHVFRV